MWKVKWGKKISERALNENYLGLKQEEILI